MKADQSLRDLSMSNDATLVLQRDSADVAQSLGALEGVSSIRQIRSLDDYPAWRIHGTADITPQVYALARDRDWPLRELRRDTVTLETFFNQLATTA